MKRDCLMAPRKTITSILKNLNDYLQKLTKLTMYSQSEFMQDFTKVESAKHLLHGKWMRLSSMKFCKKTWAISTPLSITSSTLWILLLATEYRFSRSKNFDAKGQRGKGTQREEE